MVTLVVEDGTGLANANAYIEETYVADYAELYSDFDWNSLTVAVQNKAIVNATRFIDIRYRTRFPSTILEQDQALQFPRKQFTDANGRVVEAGTIPKELKDAVAAAALFYVENGLDLQRNTDNAIKRESVGVASGAVQESIEYFFPKEDNDYIEIDALMSVIARPANTRQFNTVRG